MKKESNDIQFKEFNEILEGDYEESLRKLSAYSKILEKGGNIFIRFPKTKQHVNLRSNSSFFRICSLSDLLPEENALFTLYAILSDEESENENPLNKRGIDKLKERLLDNDEDNKDNNNNNTIKIRSKNQNKKKSKKKVKEKEDKDSVILLDEVKSSVQNMLCKEGSSIGSNYELYKVTWKNLYKWLLLFALIILIGLLYFIYKDEYGFSLAEFASFFLVFIICVTSMSGNEKMISRKRVNFKKENYLLGIIIALSLYDILCTNVKFEIAAYKFLSLYKAFVNITFATLIILCIVLIYLNKKMIDFNIRYSKILESGVLLTDRD
jgi:hypothetical protein